MCYNGTGILTPPYLKNLKRRGGENLKKAKEWWNKASFSARVMAFTLVGVPSIITIGITLINIDNSVTNIYNDHSTHVHNEVVDRYRTSQIIDEDGNNVYTVYPSRYGTVNDRSVVINHTGTQPTIVEFRSNSSE